MEQNVRKSAKSSSGKCKGVGNRAHEKCHTDTLELGGFLEQKIR